jgi:YfiH family protein
MSRTLFTSRFTGNLKELSTREIVKDVLSLDHLVFMNQTHSDKVQIVEDPDSTFDCDALITSIKGVGIAALAADCMPITFESRSVVGVAHVGRVGLLSGIATKTVRAMREVGAVDIVATIGPSICCDCYEVSPEMYRDAISVLPSAATSEVSHSLNLWGGVASQLVDLGVTVTVTGLCTLENSEYFSYRGGDISARQSGIVSL